MGGFGTGKSVSQKYLYVDADSIRAYIDDTSGKAAKGGRGKVKAASGKGPKPVKKAGVAVAAKYRGPNGESWSGRGLTPRWLTSLLAQGRSKEEFAITG